MNGKTYGLEELADDFDDGEELALTAVRQYREVTANLGQAIPVRGIGAHPDLVACACTGSCSETVALLDAAVATESCHD